MHQRANGLARKSNIDKATRGIDHIPCPDPETSLHLRIYLTCGIDIDYHAIDNIIRSVLEHAEHRQIWVTIVPKFFGNNIESELNQIRLIRLLDGLRTFDRINRVGIAFDNIDELLNNEIDVDFYGLRFSVIKKNKRVIDILKSMEKTVYSIPENVIESSEYIETLDACRYAITMVEYSSYEENRLVINDHGFIYQIHESK